MAYQEASNLCKLPTEKYNSKKKADHMISFLRTWGSNKINSYLMNERRSIPAHLIQDLAQNGFFGLQVSSSFGGQNLSHTDLFRILEQLAAIDPSIMILLNVHNFLGAKPIQKFGTDEQKKKILPLLASGKVFGGLAASESGVGSNVRAIRAVAQKTQDGKYILNGEKTWISLGAYAGFINVFAQLIDIDGKNLGITGFIVPQGIQGMTPGEECMTLGMKAIPQNNIEFKNVELSSEHLLGHEGQGLTVAQDTFMMGRLLVCINSIGGLKRCLQIASQFAKQRQIATGNLFENDYTRSVLTETLHVIRTLESLVYFAAEKLDQNEDLPSEINIACKVLGAELSFTQIDRCLQMMGARGYMDNNIVGQYFRDYRLTRIFEGPTESMNAYLGMTILKNKLDFLSMLEKQFGNQDISEKFLSVIEELQNSLNSTPDLLKSHVGELGCWTIVCALLHSKGQFNDYTWASKKLQILRDQFLNQEIPETSDFLDKEIQNLSASIGNTNQDAKGENLKMDSLLKV